MTLDPCGRNREEEPDPSQADLDRWRVAFARLSSKREESRFTSKTVVYVELGDGHYARVPLDGREFSIGPRAADAEPYIVFRTPRQLVKRILSGPRYAHWNNSVIGSHVQFDRRPDLFEPGAFHLINFFHA